MTDHHSAAERRFFARLTWLIVSTSSLRRRIALESSILFVGVRTWVYDARSIGTALLMRVEVEQRRACVVVVMYEVVDLEYSGFEVGVRGGLIKEVNRPGNAGDSFV